MIRVYWSNLLTYKVTVKMNCDRFERLEMFSDSRKTDVKNIPLTGLHFNTNYQIPDVPN